MKNKLYLAGLFLPLLCFLAAVGIYEYRQTRAYEITVPVSGYDPRSLIAGHYILLTVDESRINCTQFPDNSCPPAGFFEKSYKYFTPEGDARPLENLIRKPGNITELLFTVHPNHPPQIKDLLINGQNWKDAPQN